ncbi:2-O-methyltransferase NoeI [compost metagenome]
MIKHKITGDHGYLRISNYREYFHPLVSAEEGDWVIDGGASNGKTSFRFSSRVGSKGKVFAFEPDPTNAQKIEAGIQLQPERSNVVLMQSALSDRSGTLNFTATADGSSRLEDGGGVSVSAKRIDDLDLPKCDLISLDIEGAEASALNGAAATIRKLRPKLQISIYHRREDLFSLPLLVRTLTENYAFFIGHHDAYHSETDLYAIPRERLTPNNRHQTYGSIVGRIFKIRSGMNR